MYTLGDYQNLLGKHELFKASALSIAGAIHCVRVCEASCALGCRCFNTILVFISRNKQQHTQASWYDQLLKKNEQIFSLAAICSSLMPKVMKCFDENALVQLKERHADHITRMTNGELEL
jgi:RNA polymerase I-associated factor PAF67